MPAPQLIFLAGPNGAGKSTFYETYLRDSGLPFVNADRIAAALGISSAEAAAAADAARKELLAAQESFITETVFSDPVGAKLEFLRAAMQADYQVHLIFIGLASPHLSAGRVVQRLAAGGHDVPHERLERRFRQGMENLRAALAFLPDVSVFDNSSDVHPFRLVLKVRGGRQVALGVAEPRWLRRALRPSRRDR